MRLKVAPHIRMKSDDLVRRIHQQAKDNAKEITRSSMAAITTVGGHQVSGGALPNLQGDVQGPVSATVVARLRGIVISTTAPTDGQVLHYNAGTNMWVPGAGSGGGGGGGGFYAVVSNGDVDDPQLVQDGTGDFVMAFIPGA
jgi:hypothetical protein